MIKNEISILSFDKILNKKLNICVTFRTKHELNKMHSSMVHNKLGGLLVKELMSILEVQGLIL
jgi:hypothetical protein